MVQRFKVVGRLRSLGECHKTAVLRQTLSKLSKLGNIRGLRPHRHVGRPAPAVSESRSTAMSKTTVVEPVSFVNVN